MTHFSLRILTSLAVAGALATVPAETATQSSPSAAVTALASLEWRSVGPANPGGRVTVVAGIPGKPEVFYVAGAAGGIIKTTNGGMTFSPIFDDQPVASIGAIEIAPSNENVVWVGTGEGDPRNSTSFGNGVYRSTDGGAHWSHVGLDDTERIKRIAVDPQQSRRRVRLRARPRVGPQRGARRLPDDRRRAGTGRRSSTGTGHRLLGHRDGPVRTRATLYAGMYTFRRRPWRFDSGGGETALYKTTDGGDTWQKLTNGLPTGPDGSARRGDLAEQPEHRLPHQRDEVRGHAVPVDRQRRVVDESQRQHRDHVPAVLLRRHCGSIPRIPNRLFALAGQLQVSEDAGRTFRNAGIGLHGDHQAMWIDPKNPKRILEGCDGGFQISYDGGATWEVLNTFPFTQFYRVEIDNQQPYTICGGLQDNGVWCGPSMVTSRDGIRKRDWVTVSGGDGF